MEDVKDVKAPLSLEKVQNKIEKQLECGLCLECFYEPKVLTCNHIYCKSCMDKLLKFRPDGSASIQCPLKCEVETLIGCDKTTCDLEANIYIRGILDMISEKYGNNNDDRRCNGQNCNGRVSVFCYTCNCLLCTSCHKHCIGHENNFVSIKFDEREAAFFVVCDEHKTSAEFVCFEQECNSKFLCLYCIERSHKNHGIEAIYVKCMRVKHWLQKEEERKEDMESSIRDINQIRMKDEEKIRDTLPSLEVILKGRIVNILLQYFKSIEEEKTRLLNKFHSAANVHRQTYPETNIEEFFDKFKKVEDIIVLLMEKNARTYLAKLASAKINLPTVTVSLSDPTTSKPLGDVDVNPGPKKSINDESDDGNFTSNFYGCEEKSYNVSDLWEAVENLVGKRDFKDARHNVVSANIDDNELKMKSLEDKGIQVIDETKHDEKIPDIQVIPPATDINYDFKFLLYIGLSFVIGVIAVVIGSYIPFAASRVNGGYSEWTKFSACSKSCGEGLKTRERFCNNPVPKNGGTPCSVLGIDKEIEQCNIRSCFPSTFEFRFINGQKEVVARSYPEFNAEFVGFGIGFKADGSDADPGTLRKRTSSLSECLEYCANQKRLDDRVNGVQYEMYGNLVCYCEHNYVTHIDRNDHLHYKLL